MAILSDKITAFSGNKILKCGKITLNYDKPLVMGILNLTPDSFFDGGKYSDTEKIISRVDKMITEGASIIDLGAVSSRPGAGFVSEDEEIKRLIPNLEILKSKFPDTVFSIDTFRAKVVQLAYDSGAGMINDISGGNFDVKLIETVAETDLPYVLMHMKGSPADMQQNPEYENVVNDINAFFRGKLDILSQAGIDQVILDPGFGFGKTIEHNYSLLRNLKVFKKSGSPILVGISRKSMIYKYLHIAPDEALPATTALHLQAILNGADILRVHDVKETVEVIKLSELLTKDME